MKPEEPSPHKIKPGLKLWKKLLIGFLASLTFLFLAALVAAGVLEDKLISRIVAEINQQITVPVKVDGGIRFSLFRHFPNAALTFSKVSIEDKLRKNGKKLLNVDEISFLCNVFHLFGNEVEFSKILIKGGELSLFRDESGNSNFEILKPQKAAANNNYSVRLRAAQINGVNFIYVDKMQATDIDLKIKDVLFSGNFADKFYNLEAKAKIIVKRIRTGSEEFLKGKNISAAIMLDVDKGKQKYQFKKGTVGIEESEFSITGYLTALKNATQLNFKFMNAGKDMQQLFAILPEKYKKDFAGADGSGEYSISADINGILGRNSYPKINVQVDLKNSELKLGKYQKLLKKVNASAYYEADESGNDKLVISNFNCTLNELPFNFRLSLSHLANPFFDFYANGALHLAELASFIPDSVVQDMEGTIAFNNFRLKGKKQDFSDVENSTLEGSGEFKLNEVEFRQNGITYGNINGLLQYADRQIEARDFTINFLGTDFNFTGSIANLLPFAYNLNMARKSNNIVLGINGRIKTKTFDLTGILNAYDRKNRPLAQQKEKINIGEIFSMKGNVDVEIGKFIFRQLVFDDLKTNLQIVPGIIQVNSLSTSTMGGSLKTMGAIRFTPENALNLNIDVRAVDLDVPVIFRECENFGQSTLTDRNLRGTMSVATSINATWKNYKELDEQSLSAVVDYKIKNGRLIKFEPLKAASRFIRVEELEDIRFADLENTIKISNGRIDIPEFEIKTSALNLMFFGFHYFDNRIDYHFKINLHKMLAQKYKRNKRDEVFIESDPYEGVNVYLAMTGNLSDPQIKFDKANTRNKIQNDFRQEKTVLRDLLNNTSKKPVIDVQKQEEKYFNVKEEPMFMEFDTTSE